MVVTLAIGAGACGSDKKDHVSASGTTSSTASASSDSSSTTTSAEDTTTSAPTGSGGPTTTRVSPAPTAAPTTTVPPQSVVVMDVSGSNKMRTNSFSANGTWVIHGDVGTNGQLLITILDSAGNQVDRVIFDAPGGDSQRSESCLGCSLEIESFDRNSNHVPTLPAPGYHVVVTDTVG